MTSTRAMFTDPIDTMPVCRHAMPRLEGPTQGMTMKDWPALHMCCITRSGDMTSPRCQVVHRRADPLLVRVVVQFGKEGLVHLSPLRMQCTAKRRLRFGESFRQEGAAHAAGGDESGRRRQGGDVHSRATI